MDIKGSFELLFPYLLVVWILSFLLRYAGLHTIKRSLAVPLTLFLAGAMTFIPVRGLSLAGYLLSVNPVFSVGSVCLVAAGIWKQFTGRKLFSEMDLLLFSTWIIAISLYVHLSWLGFIRYDLYYLGYGFSAFFVITAVVTIMLLLFGSPVSWIFIAYILSYVMRLLPSNNYFDYVTDVPLFIFSLAILITYSVKSIISMSRATDTTATARP